MVGMTLETPRLCVTAPRSVARFAVVNTRHKDVALVRAGERLSMAAYAAESPVCVMIELRMRHPGLLHHRGRNIRKHSQVVRFIVRRP